MKRFIESMLIGIGMISLGYGLGCKRTETKVIRAIDEYVELSKKKSNA